MLIVFSCSIFPYSGKFSRGTIFVDGWSLAFHGLNFHECVHSCPLCAIQLSLFCGFKFHSWAIIRENWTPRKFPTIRYIILSFNVQLPSSNCSNKELNYTLVIENEQGNVMAEVNTFPSLDSGVIRETLAIDLNEDQKYFVQLQVTAHSQIAKSQKHIFSELSYHSTCSIEP